MNTRMTVMTMLVAVAVTAAPLGTEFTYQGVLSDAGAPAAGTFDFRFLVYDAEAGGSQVGLMVVVEDLAVTDGRITAQLDFGAVFDGTALWLEVGVRDGSSTGAYTVLSPRQELTAAPFAQHAATAETAGHAMTAGDAGTLDGQNGAYYLAWSNLTGIPADIANGDDDTLGSLACTEGQIARWNGAAWTCSEDDDTPYVRTYVVGPVGTPIENGAALGAAMGSIPPPTNQETAALLKIEPGVYDLGTGTEALLPWMVIEGAGRDHTRITSARCGMGIYEGTLLSTSRDVTLRRLTVENTCANPGNYSVALSNQGLRLTLEDVRLIVNQGAHRDFAIFNSGDGLTVQDAILEAGNAVNRSVGLWNQGLGVQLGDVSIRAGGSEVNRGIENDGTTFTVQRTVVQLWGGVSECTGLLNNTGADPLFVDGLEVKNFCSSASDNGLYLNGTGGTLRNVIVSAGDTAISLHNLSTFKNLYLHELELEVGGSGYGVWCQDEGSNGLSVTIQRSQIRTAGTAVYNHFDECTVRIGGSHIEGGVTGAATCAGLYDGGYTFFVNTCPPP